MPTINEFSDFEAFKKSRLFVKDVGTLVRKTRIATDLDAVRQIKRASISVLSNFAEGFERDATQSLFSTYRMQKVPSGRSDRN